MKNTIKLVATIITIFNIITILTGCNLASNIYTENGKLTYFDISTEQILTFSENAKLYDLTIETSFEEDWNLFETGKEYALIIDFDNIDSISKEFFFFEVNKKEYTYKSRVNLEPVQENMSWSLINGYGEWRKESDKISYTVYLDNCDSDLSKGVFEFYSNFGKDYEEYASFVILDSENVRNDLFPGYPGIIENDLNNEESVVYNYTDFEPLLIEEETSKVNNIIDKKNPPVENILSSQSYECWQNSADKFYSGIYEVEENIYDNITDDIYTLIKLYNWSDHTVIREYEVDRIDGNIFIASDLEYGSDVLYWNWDNYILTLAPYRSEGQEYAFWESEYITAIELLNGKGD